MYQRELTPQEIRKLTVLTTEHEEKLIDFVDRQREAIEQQEQHRRAQREAALDAFCALAAIITTAIVCFALWAR